MPKVILSYGTFDLFHVGHLNLLERLRTLGDYLIVGVSTDRFNESKGKKTIISFEDRMKIVGGLKCVDHVIAEDSWEQKRSDILLYKADVLGMGDDWQGKFDDLDDICKIVYLPRTAGICSSNLKEILNVLDRTHVTELKKALDIISSIVTRFD